MATVEGAAFPALSAMGFVKTPPLVHPLVLAKAAAQCAEFGGNRDALEAAALAGALIEARMLHSQRAIGSAKAPNFPATGLAQASNISPVGVSGIAPAGTTPSSSFALGAAAGVTPEVSDQMKQAMAAAEATNTQPKVPPPPTNLLKEESLITHQVPMPPEIQMNAPVLHNLPPNPEIVPMVPPLGSIAAMAQGMALAAGMQPPLLHHPMNPMNSLMMPMPPPIPTQQPPPPAIRLPQINQQMDQVSRDTRDVREIREPAPRIPEPPTPVPQAPQNEEKKEPPKPKEPASAKADEAEPVRCHLHRKPQLNCKICRRLYYSTLAPDYNKKADKKKDDFMNEKGVAGLGDETFPRRQIAEAFEITNKQTYNFNAMLRDQILKSTYFKSLMNIDTFEGIVDELYQFADTAEVYGAGTTTVPSTLFCCLFRFFTIGISYDELHQLLNSKDSPYIRCCGFLYIRFGCAPEKLWEQMGEYCLDDAEFEPSKSTPSFTVTIGEYVEALLMDERYYYTALPRIPVATKKKIEELIAPLLQYRRRTMANKRSLHLFRQPSAPIEACIQGEWREGTSIALLEGYESRILMRCRLEGIGEETVHIGKIIIREDRRVGRRGKDHSRSRSRSPHRGRSPDWSREKGKSDAELVQDLRARQRERAVCSSGKDYARKPIGFMSGLALKREMGVASSRLREEETYAPRQVEKRKQLTEEEEMERRKEERVRQEVDRELQLRQQQLFEKYGTSNPKEKAASKDAPATLDEAPEVLRLG